MLDAGLSEIALILLLALIIVGPKRLPEVASKIGHWVSQFKKMQQSLHKVYNEYADYPNAGKHLLGLDSKSENSNHLDAIKQEFDDIKKEVGSLGDELNTIDKPKNNTEIEK